MAVVRREIRENSVARKGIVLARYTFARDGQWLSNAEQKALLDELNLAPPVAYRVRDPQPNDRTNYIIQPRQTRRKGHRVLTWIVCKDLNHRTVRKVDRRRQAVSFEFEDTDDCLLARIVALPDLGVMAAEDGTGDGHIGGWSSIKRFQSIAQAQDEGVEFSATIAGTAQDLERAITQWDLDKFTFEARPFNPHPSNPGKMLSDMLAADGIGRIRATTLPKDGEYITPKDSGIVQETLGLANAGYAVYGAEGTTPSGAEARVKKPKFSFNRDENKNRLIGPQQLRVHVDAEENDIVQKFADVLIDFFAPVDQADEV